MLKFFRTMAWLTGVALAFNTFIALPYQYGFHGESSWPAYAWQVHGFLYMIYVVAAFLLSRQQNWALKRTVLFLLAGTIPLASFFADRRARSLVA